MDRKKIWLTLTAMAALGFAAWFVFHSSATRSPTREAARLAKEPIHARSTNAAQPSADVSRERSGVPAATWFSTDDPAYAVWQKAIAEDLAARNDPDSLATAALMLYALRSYPVEKSLVIRVEGLLQRAGDLAPRDAGIQSLLVSFCQAHQDCDSSRYETAMQTLEPQNAFGWMAAAVRANHGASDEALQRAFEGAAQCETYNSHTRENIERMLRTIDTTRVPPPSSMVSADYSRMRDSVTYGAVFMAPGPNLPSLIYTCGPGYAASLGTPCLRAAAAMERSDVLVARFLANSIETAMAKPGSADAQHAAEGGAKLEWLLDQISGAPIMQPTDWTRLLTSSTSEVEVLQKWLAEHNLPSEPPKK